MSLAGPPTTTTAGVHFRSSGLNDLARYLAHSSENVNNNNNNNNNISNNTRTIFTVLSS